MPEPISQTNEPTALSASLAQFIAKHEPGSRLHGIGADLLRSHGVNRDRRSAVLKHEDLTERLVAELGYANAGQWNGYVPPAFTDPGGGEHLCQGASPGRYGEFRSRLNQVGRYALGEMPNNSPRRAALLDISREAWEREHQPAAEPETALELAP